MLSAHGTIRAPKRDDILAVNSIDAPDIAAAPVKTSNRHLNRGLRSLIFAYKSELLRKSPDDILPISERHANARQRTDFSLEVVEKYLPHDLLGALLIGHMSPPHVED